MHVLQSMPTVCRSVVVGGCVPDMKLRVDGPRVTALLPVDGEEPAASSVAFRASIYQS